MLILFFGCLDFVRYNLLRNVITNAAYEGARTAIVPGVTTSDVEAVIERKMAPVSGAMSYTIDIDPSSLPTTNDDITVTIDVDISTGGFVVSKYFTQQRVRESITILNENSLRLRR